MSVAAFVSAAEEARRVVVWAGRFAAAQGTDLIVYYVPESVTSESMIIAVDGSPEDIADGTRRAIDAAVESVVRTKHARRGRIARHDVSVRRVPEPDALSATLSRLRVESPELLVVGPGCPSPEGKNGKRAPVPKQLAAKCSCSSVVLYGDGPRTLKVGSLVVGTSEGSHDTEALEVAAATARSTGGSVTAVGVEADIGERAIEVGDRALRGMLRELSLEESSHLAIKTVLGDDRVAAICGESEGCDLLLVGADLEAGVERMCEAAPKATIGVFRRGARLEVGRAGLRMRGLLPRLNPTDYANLFEQLQIGSRWNSDFIMMLGLASAIATLGLLQNSPAVVIGSMLLAPLMTPMIGMGLALNQGNRKLAYSCFRAIGRGFFTALAISAAIGWITPGTDLTPEVFARTEPNILDLLVALFSGVAAAYALARPSVAGTIAGVAIATALVPPLCSVGICLSYARWHASLGALFLLVANVLAIILAAAATFSGMGLWLFTQGTPRRFWVRNVVIGLGLCVVGVSIPLVTSFMQQVREGKTAPIAFAVTDDLRQALLDHVATQPGVDVLFMGRSGTARQVDPVDVAVILTSPHPLPRSSAEEIKRLIRDTMASPDLKVRVECVVGGWAEEMPEVPVVETAAGDAG